MNARLFSELEVAIQKWMDKNCERADWIDAYVGNQTVTCMAKAAAAVLDACEESQQFVERECVRAKVSAR